MGVDLYARCGPSRTRFRSPVELNRNLIATRIVEEHAAH